MPLRTAVFINSCSALLPVIGATLAATGAALGCAFATGFSALARATAPRTPWAIAGLAVGALAAGFAVCVYTSGTLTSCPGCSLVLLLKPFSLYNNCGLIPFCLAML